MLFVSVVICVVLVGLDVVCMIVMLFSVWFVLSVFDMNKLMCVCRKWFVLNWRIGLVMCLVFYDGFYYVGGGVE